MVNLRPAQPRAAVGAESWPGALDHASCPRRPPRSGRLCVGRFTPATAAAPVGARGGALAFTARRSADPGPGTRGVGLHRSQHAGSAGEHQEDEEFDDAVSPPRRTPHTVSPPPPASGPAPYRDRAKDEAARSHIPARACPSGAVRHEADLCCRRQRGLPVDRKALPIHLQQVIHSAALELTRLDQPVRRRLRYPNNGTSTRPQPVDGAIHDGSNALITPAIPRSSPAAG